MLGSAAQHEESWQDLERSLDSTWRNNIVGTATLSVTHGPAALASPAVLVSYFSRIPRDAESESAYSQDPQVITMHINV